jgi:hypothetical protein
VGNYQLSDELISFIFWDRRLKMSKPELVGISDWLCTNNELCPWRFKKLHTSYKMLSKIIADSVKTIVAFRVTISFSGKTENHEVT